MILATALQQHWQHASELQQATLQFEICSVQSLSTCPPSSNSRLLQQLKRLLAVLAGTAFDACMAGMQVSMMESNSWAYCASQDKFINVIVHRHTRLGRKAHSMKAWAPMYGCVSKGCCLSSMVRTCGGAAMTLQAGQAGEQEGQEQVQQSNAHDSGSAQGGR